MGRYYPGYAAALAKVEAQSLEDDLRLIDNLFGRGRLKYGDGPEAVKDEALRQVEIEWRDMSAEEWPGKPVWDRTPGEP